MATAAIAGRYRVPRRYPRWPVRLELQYGAPGLVSGHVLDISEGGIAFTGVISYPVGSALEILVPQGIPGRWFKARGVVRHSSPGRMGVEFVDLAQFERARILDIIYQDIATRRR